jgi:branched-chain amino acid transport system permease protein
MLRYKLSAIREDEVAAAAVGIDVLKCKLIAAAISGAFLGIGGVFYLQFYRYINPDIAFGIDFSILLCTIAIFGGMRFVVGPTIGAAILIPLSEALRISLGSTFTGIYLIFYGLILIVFIMFQPRGVYGFIRGRLAHAT